MSQAEVRSIARRIGDWLAAGRCGIERPAYILHRISGLGILLYFLLHIVITSLRVKRLYLWEEPYPLEDFKFGEFLVFAAFAYHAFNGIRLLLLYLLDSSPAIRNSSRARPFLTASPAQPWTCRIPTVRSCTSSCATIPQP